jgi:NAD(P)-dependent dehydrogenase (short-subunit alcohol dehydrogenase family)
VDHAGVLAAVDVNAVGPLRMVQGVLPNLLAAAPAPLVINVSSRLGSLAGQAAGDFAGLDSRYAYRMSKAAQNMLTVAAAQELAGWVRCWAVHPGQPGDRDGPAGRDDLAGGGGRPASPAAGLGGDDLPEVRRVGRPCTEMVSRG